MRKILLNGAGLIVCGLVASCGPQISGSEIHEGATYVACHGFKHITWSKRDTDETINEIKNFNATLERTCK